VITIDPHAPKSLNISVLSLTLLLESLDLSRLIGQLALQFLPDFLLFGERVHSDDYS